MMTFGSLFSGIGGFDLGLERAGMVCKWQCEIDPFCTKVLTKHWPDVPKYGDIKELRGDELEPVDLICGGFPCQPFSTAGQRQGTEDDRYLWPEMLRVITELQPPWVIGENVAGIVSMALEHLPAQVESRTLSGNTDYDIYSAVLSRQEIMLLDRVCQDLEAQNYEVQPILIPACSLNANHLRYRVWIIANSEGGEPGEQETGNRRESSGRGSQKIITNPNGNNCESWRAESAGQQWETRITDGSNDVADPPIARSRELPVQPGRPLEAGINIDRDGEDVANPQVRGRNGSHTEEPGEHQRQWTEPIGGCSGIGVTTNPNHAGRTQQRRPITDKKEHAYSGFICHTASEGFPDWAGGTVGQPRPVTEFERPGGREIERDFRGAPHGVSRRVDRLKSLGNAVVPQIPEIIGRMILEVEELT